MHITTKLAAATFAMGLGVVLASTAADAAVIQSRVTDSGSVVGALSLSSTTGVLSVGGVSTSNFNVSFTVTGVGLVDAPGFGAITTNISSRPGGGAFGTHTLKIEFSQTDVQTSSATSTSIAQFATTLAINLLAGAPNISGISVAAYVNSSNTAFGTEQLLAQIVSSGGAGGSTGTGTPVIASASLLGSLFSETFVITATFTQRGANLQTNSQIEGVPVPEPLSLSLLGAGLLGLGLVRSRRKA